ncbi:hypothetical protein [Spartinivicinus poritis]|uniref:Uncharacterized protein n=1 Tax=Spartinivicinus poritis TaxID=2994640 RepID=A0ABT5UBH8_9GAMM|nr:hypothetical protein [Spartinivicinus sp. A2-2]MDE1463734.1 hypothetical protein [Spartinivicinus sp. A2-2]
MKNELIINARFANRVLRHQQKVDRLNNYCSAVEQLPCVMGGVSPFLLNDSTRITGLLLTVPNYHYHHYPGMASMKRMSDGSVIRRRVEQPSLQDSTKAAYRTTVPPLKIPSFGVCHTLSYLLLLFITFVYASLLLLNARVKSYCWSACNV